MSAESGYASSKKPRKPEPAGPAIYGIFDKSAGCWYMVSGLVFHTPFPQLAQAQLAAMHVMAGPNRDESRFDVRVIGVEPDVPAA